MAIEDIDNLTRPLSDLVGEQGEKAARRKKQLAEVRATRAAGMTADEAKAAAERGDFGDVGQGEERMDFLATPLVTPTDFNLAYNEPGALDYADRFDFKEKTKKPSLINKAIRTGIMLAGPGKFVRGAKLLMSAPDIIGGIFKSGKKIKSSIDEINDIYTNPIKRKDRMLIRSQMADDQNLNNIVNLAEASMGKSGRAGGFDQKLLSDFADVYNSKDLFKIEYLRNNMKNFKSIFNSAKEKKLIDMDAVNSIKNINKATNSVERDLQLDALEKLLRQFKKDNPTATGLDLKKNVFGDFDIEDIFAMDDSLKDIIGSKAKRQTILNKLKEEGILDELGLLDIFKTGEKAKTISDPQILAYLKEIKKDSLPKNFDFTSKILNKNQKQIFSNLTEQITKNLPEQLPGTLRKNLKDIIRNNVNRSIKYGVRDQGKSIDEIMTSIKKQTDDPSFIKEVLPLIIRKVELSDYLKRLELDLGVTLDNVDLSHMKAVVEDIDQTFKINNLFIGLSKKNAAESKIAQNIRDFNVKLNKKNISKDEKIQLAEKIKSLKNELKTGDYYDPVSINYPSPDDVGSDVSQQIKEKISETMMGDPTYFKKDGGIISMKEMIQPISLKYTS